MLTVRCACSRQKPPGGLLLGHLAPASNDSGIARGTRIGPGLDPRGRHRHGGDVQPCFQFQQHQPAIALDYIGVNAGLHIVVAQLDHAHRLGLVEIGVAIQDFQVRGVHPRQAVSGRQRPLRCNQGSPALIPVAFLCPRFQSYDGRIAPVGRAQRRLDLGRRCLDGNEAFLGLGGKGRKSQKQDKGKQPRG